MTIIIKTKINDDHQQGNHHMCGMKINMGNVNCHEWVMSNESHHIVGGMLVCQCRVHKSVGSNPYVDRPRPSSPFPKIYTKIVNKHVSPTGETGRGGWKLFGNLGYFSYLSHMYTGTKWCSPSWKRVKDRYSVKGTKISPGPTKHGNRHDVSRHGNQQKKACIGNAGYQTAFVYLKQWKQ